MRSYYGRLKLFTNENLIKGNLEQNKLEFGLKILITTVSLKIPL